MKTLTLTFSTVLLIAFAEHILVNAQTRMPETVLKDFYQWYIRAVDVGPDPFRRSKPTMRKYVTVRLMEQIARDEARGLDADSFVMTQEWDADWAKHVTVSELSIKGAKATAIVTFGKDNYPRVAVTLVKVAGIWKIDRVRDAVVEVPTSSPDEL
ncbi:MAG: DUF3828 domain-containing protein [Acidobacteriota bacterium]